jgi:hypothetical protein
VVLGGMHVTLASEEAARHADSAITGDAEAVWAVVIHDTEHGRIGPV